MEHTYRAASNLKPHPGQSRTTGDADALAQLTVQIATQGLMEDRPIVVNEDGEVVKGMRRWSAYMVAHHLSTLDDVPETLGVEEVADVIRSLTQSEQWVMICPHEDCHAILENDRGPRMVCHDGHSFYRDEWVTPDDPLYDDDEMLEDPDFLRSRIEQTIAKAHDPDLIPTLNLALSERYPNVMVPVLVRDFEDDKEEVLELVADNFGGEEPDTLGLMTTFNEGLDRGLTVEEIAGAVGKTPHFVEGIVSLAKLREDVRERALNADWPLTIPTLLAELEGDKLEGAQAWLFHGYHRPPVDRVRRAVERLKTYDPDAKQLELDATAEHYNGLLVERWAWNRALERDPVSAYRILASDSHRFVLELLDLIDMADEDEGSIYEELPELTCENCRLEGILKGVPKLHWRPGYPCQTEPDSVGCMAAVSEAAPMTIRVGWRYDGECEQVGGRYIVRDVKAFVDHMATLVKDDEVEVAGDSFDSGKRMSDLDVQRERIAKFIAYCETLSGADHPLATVCSKCQHKTTVSPVQSKEVPHCQWARRRRSVEFVVWTSDDYRIPVCKQYAPLASLNEIVPEFTVGAHLPRSVMIDNIRDFAGYMQSKSGAVLEQLTGRAMSKKDRSDDWFLKRFEEEVGDLSDLQITTLYTWVIGVMTGRYYRPWRYEPSYPGFRIPLPIGTYRYFKSTSFPFSEFKLDPDPQNTELFDNGAEEDKGGQETG